ncbi:MAG: DUF1207 domain-containing protein [Proteobacteria bacterium]|nr:DUF1207 domain-containing protein [Pseudomonadota bacterium]MCG2743541.1 DUF1207 domain-containing protein [Desulfobacteraceae bacterium]MBU3982645.1 DUF1207 domain-containing protein [Pseudomonadota bacterium]MBU4027363.1 DUF1207 domain-containing protein [Pseudomonadota bacterium]MBU4044438.1 DUF1207 domain-containing protein [Pseudomonadota bacterium]
MMTRTSTWLYMTARLGAAALGLMLIFQSPMATAADRVSDEFLTGYIASILERDMLWERDSYLLKIVNGVVTITLFEDDQLRREAADKQLRALDGVQEVTIEATNKQLRAIDGVQEVAIEVKSTDTDMPEAVNSFMGVTDAGKVFPTGDLFRSFIADPKQSRFFVSLDNFRSLGEDYTLAAVGFGETFGLYRFFGTREGDGLQLSILAGLFAQFNMDNDSSDLINADYTIGIPATYRYGDNSLRLRLYHQSSHLGDEFLLGANPPDRINLSYEATELIYSYEWREFRVYGGGEYIIHKEPSDLKPLSAHWGIEYRGSTPLVWNGRPIAGVDIKNLEEHEWTNDTSVKVGLEFGNPNPGQRRLILMAEWYKGFDPYGQFYNNKVEYYGLGLSLGF